MKRHRLWSVVLVLTLALVMALPVVATGCKKAPPPEKVLTMSYYVPVETLDPPKISRAPDYEFAMNIFNGLVRYKPGSDPIELEPDLATKWDISPDGLVYTFYLRKGVQWQSGYGEFTAKDVKYTFERVKDPELKSTYKSDFDYISSVDIIDDHTVTITLSKPYADFLSAVLAFRGGYIVNEQAIKDRGDEWRAKPVGTGPYMVESYVTGADYVLLANPDYFRGKPKIDKVIYKVIPEETTQVLALVNGEVDFAALRQPEAFNLAKEKGLSYTATPVAGRFAATVNITRPGVEDVRVRQALAYALDRQEFVDSFWKGMATAEGIWSVIPPGVFGHTDDVQEYQYDVEKAKSFLAEAGYPGGEGLPSLYSLGRPAYTPIDEILQGYWSAIGVDLKVDEQDGASLTAKWGGGDYDFYMSGPTRAATDQFLLPISSKQKPGCYTAYDSLIEAQRSETDPAQRLEILKELQQQVAKDVVHIPIVRELYVTAYRSNVTGAVPNTFFWLWYWDLMDITE